MKKTVWVTHRVVKYKTHYLVFDSKEAALAQGIGDVTEVGVNPEIKNAYTLGLTHQRYNKARTKLVSNLNYQNTFETKDAALNMAERFNIEGQYLELLHTKGAYNDTKDDYTATGSITATGQEFTDHKGEVIKLT